MHISADATGDVLLAQLNGLGTITRLHGKTGTELKAGRLYLAPSDHHLMIGDDEKIVITKGAQENRSQPSIHPLFRPAAIVSAPG